MTSVQSDTGVLDGEERMLIDGELQHTGSGATFDVIHPASEQVAGQATDGTVADMARAVSAARRAFDETDWSRDLEFRYHCLTQLHEALERNKEHRARRRRLQRGTADGGDDGLRHEWAVVHPAVADLVAASRYDEGIEILKTSMEGFPVGDPWTPGVMQGPQISETQRQKVLGLIRSGIDSGARLVTGGGVPENLPVGYYTQPTLLADVDPDRQIAQEEIFGPVLTVTPYDTDDEAVAIANNTINGKSHFGVTSPFGGTKQSGLGYRNGEEGCKEYLEAKTIGMPDTAAPKIRPEATPRRSPRCCTATPAPSTPAEGWAR